MFEKCDSSNRQKQMVASFRKVYSKIWVDFCLKSRKRFFLEISFKLTERAYVFLESGTRDY